ncbi:DUF6179 domain-containing protein [Desulfosporosinus sp. PR]|uniref:DUF6179 domain-containing protein n=1 Tax=Candidatus Desulfosporosinus nitrosoreducens TaxID=3401928 RepID=UPI0027F7EB54|nr:DUF6179 domain-containing protein [Desulfosporosinus sp. PR]MDQ7095385.1 DUF6179 domain-containing protein [Desulfosporosinus sp. PR]
MNNLEKKSLLPKETLDESAYFQAILEKARRLRLLTVAEYEAIQIQSIELLTKQLRRYTFGESSSVKVETAQSTMQSIFYTLGICLKSLADADMSLAALKQKPLSELYQQGKTLIREQIAQARQLLAAIQDDDFSTDNQAYNDTIRSALPSFFSDYDPDFSAHDTPAPIDYPLSSDNGNLAGIEYILNYLQTLRLENQFLHRFGPPALNSLLRSFNSHYQDLLINIFELTATNALGCILAGKNPLLLDIQPTDIACLKARLDPWKIEEKPILPAAVRHLCQKLNISGSPLQKHLEKLIPDLSVRLKNALLNNSLNSIFISFQAKPLKPAWQFAEGVKMEDERFRAIVNEIKDCRYVSDKLAIIREEVHSLTDFMDILESYCIFEHEFNDLFQSLGDMELAILTKKLPADKLADSALHFTENEKEWLVSFINFLANMDSSRLKTIKDLAENISLGNKSPAVPPA